MNSGFRGEIAENCAVTGYYAASSGNFVPTFRDNPSSHPQGSRVLNLDKKLPLLAAFNNPEERSAQV